MQQIQTIAPLLTIYDLDVLPDDGKTYELFEGGLSVAKAPSLNHQQLIIRLGTILMNYLDQNPIGTVWSTPGVIFDEYNSAIPDLAFVVKERIPQIASGIHIVGAPDLAIEIVSPESIERDRVDKFHEHQHSGVKEFWLIDPDKYECEFYQLIDDKFQLIEKMAEGIFYSKIVTGFFFHVEHLWKMDSPTLEALKELELL